MKAKELLAKIHRENQVFDKSGIGIKLNSNVDAQEGEFIQQIIEVNKYSKSIEIGCAFGISSLYICDALSQNPKPSHTIIDPFQKTEWKGIGIENLNRAGISFYRHIGEVSEIALPGLLADGESFDFAFIDGWHTFDHTLIDFFYLNRLLNVGGTIIIDDVGMLSIRKLMRYLINYPAYEVTGGVELPVNRKRKLFNSVVKKPLKMMSGMLPRKFLDEIFSPEFLKSDKRLSLDVSMIALKKVAEDNRPWNWFEGF